ncbi:hypothetical protein [Flavobacterium olei]
MKLKSFYLNGIFNDEMELLDELYKTFNQNLTGFKNLLGFDY